VKIRVSVIDGVHGRPAEGVQVSLVISQVREPSIQVGGHTDSYGNFSYSSGAESPAYAENCGVLIEVDAYFASLGIMAGYKQIALQLRLANACGEHQIVTIITPYAHVAASIR
jgi:5-hydroxyisourate hydrolase-like protein (transthyretin family)